MTRKIILSLSILLLTSQLILFNPLIPIIRAETEIPVNFYQDLNLNGTYIYNVTQFGGDLNWLGFDWASKYNTTTNSGGQIVLNFTGFYNKDPGDLYNSFGSPMPYMDVEFVEDKFGVLISNSTFYNVSNGEAAFNMLLGYNSFQSGFLIPLDNLTALKELALVQDSGFMEGDITVEESFNLISFDFKQNTGFQNTSLIYDKTSGLLIKALTKTLPYTDPLGYTLEMSLINYSLDLDTLFTYNVSKFEGAAFWYDWEFNYVDTWTTNVGGLVTINFTGFYPRDPGEPVWSLDAFSLNIMRAWLDIEIFYDGYFGPIGPIISFNNISNREAALQMGIGYMGFQSGFLMPQIDNISLIKEKAMSEANPGEVTITETDLTIAINYDQIEGVEQKTHFVYEKFTGLLLWVSTEIIDYVLEMALIGYDLPNAPVSPPGEPENLIPSYPIYAFGTIIGISILIIVMTNKKKILKLNQ